MKVYIAGPYTEGDTADNVSSALRAADVVKDAGMVPFVPHLYHFWHFVSPRPYEHWMALDLEWLKSCDALLRLPGRSGGADREEQDARSLGIPVTHSLQALIAERDLWRAREI